MTPEAFAKQLAADIGVGGEFAPLIAHNIREQLLRFKKERLADGDRDQDPLTTVYRPVDTAEWAPILETLTPEELEKVVLDKERSIRYVVVYIRMLVYERYPIFDYFNLINLFC